MPINILYRYLLFFSFSSFFLPASFAQLSLLRYDSIPVIEDSVVLKNPWAGGINSALFSQIDLNMDGVKDLFVFEKEGNIIRPFIKVGTEYHYASEYVESFPKMTVFAFLEDYNFDGKEDIFAFAPGGMTVYKNISTPLGGLDFTFITPLLLANYNPGYYNLYVAPTDKPAFIDADNDGDMDILAWTINGDMVNYFKNLSMETFGNCDSLMFNLSDACWGKFYESTNNPVFFPHFCKGPAGNPGDERTCACPANLLALDIDGDSDKDLLLGRLTFKTMSLLYNGGDTNAAAIIAQDTLFPSNTTPVSLLFPAGFYMDLSNDSIKDLVVTTSLLSGTENFTSVWLYTNSGSNDVPVFNFQKKNFLQETMIDLGSGCNPAFFDYNADGLMDMVVGNYGYFNTASSQYNGQLVLFENTGTATAPEFTLITRDYAHLFSEYLMAVYPTFGDIDNDGDADMIIGQYYGGLYLYENTAGPGNTADFTLTAPDFALIDVGWYAAPQLVDVNRDGLLDLLVGMKNGLINYYQNTGTSSLPFFDSTPTIDTLGGIDVEIPCCTGYSAPFLFESEPGNYSLLVGSQRGTIYYYTNIDGNLSGNFTLTDSIVSGENRVSLSMADINQDEKFEMALGTFSGGMQILKSDFLTDRPEAGSRKPEVQVFPNPNNGKFNLECSMLNAQCSIGIFNVFGEMVFQSQIYPGLCREKSQISFDLSSRPNGIYFLHFFSGEKTLVKKVVKL